MILYIDTTGENSILKLIKKNTQTVYAVKNINNKNMLSEELSISIDNLLDENSLCKKDIKLIAVNPGPGSYTGTRIGITTANLLAYSLNIAIIASKEQQLNKNIKKHIKNEYFSSPVLPIYQYPPHITKSKSRL